MTRVVVIDEREGLAELLVERLRESPSVETCQRAPQGEDGFAGLLSGGRDAFLQEQEIDAVVYAPPPESRRRPTPDLADAEAVFKECARAGVRHFVLLSSAAVYGASHHNIGFLPESRVLVRQDGPTLSGRWLELESLAAFHLGEVAGTRLVILRAAPTPVPGGADYFSRLLGARLAVTLPGHDPSLQLLSPEDLAGAVRCALEGSARGVYNVAPDGVVPLRTALRLAGAKRLPLSRTLQRLARGVLARAGVCHPVEQLDYVRYSWTVSNRKAKGELGFTPSRSSADAVREFRAAERMDGQASASEPARLEEFDDFGMDKGYIDAFGRTLFRFLHDRYWRVEVKGLEHVPARGRAVLVGVHRGFMPWDAVMTLHLLARERGRYPRFLIHPGLVRFPFLSNFHTKLGGVIACQENADRLLERGEVLAIYPEGIRGAFTLYRDAYRLGKFGRDEFVKVALRHRAPIVPFVTVGSAEIFPIIGKLNWGWWKRHTEWPFFPITPTWPLAPVPLPSKWHTLYLPPLNVEDRYPPEAADDPETVRAVSREVRARMEEALQDLKRRRKSIFFGSVFDGPGARAAGLSCEEKVAYKEEVGLADTWKSRVSRRGNMLFWPSLRRLAHITRVVVRHALAHVLGALVGRRPGLARRLRVRRVSGPERLRVMLEDMGGTFIKFGQMLALQPDIISLEYCSELFNLLDRVSPVPAREMERIVAEELGAPPAEIFDEFDPRPLATASVGQVHVGRVGGRKVAVKVQRPNVEVDFAGDIRLMAAAIRLIKRLRLRRLYWMLEPTGEFLAWTHEELDYRCEARYMERLGRNARGNPHERVPEVFWHFTTRRTLVTEFFEGETLLAYLRALESGDPRVFERLRATGFEPDRMARHIIDNFLGDVFRHGMFHADLHPANLMILPGNTVGYIDFGITGTISGYSRQNLVALTLAYTRGDLEGMCEAFFRISVFDSESSPVRFREGLRVFAETWYEADGRERRLRKNFTLVMLDMLRLSRRTGVWPERDVVKYIRSAIAIDGLITRFAPTFDLGRHLQTVCDSHLRWSARRAMFTYDSILDWAISGGNVMRDGPLRAAAFVDRLAAGEVEAQAVAVAGDDRGEESLRRRAVQLGAAVFAVALAATATGGAASIGVNLFTAELLFVGAASALLLRTVRRLA